MANYVNNSGQTRLGWRVTTQPVVTPYLTTLLDLYSGAAAAYSLRKLKSSYTGSAIRVRRSSDNTEMNIGFDSVGNLDTYALSSFVGTGNGFVTTWYDQSGNSQNGIQSTAASQPKIVNNGSIVTDGGKPSVIFNNVNTSIEFRLNKGGFSGFDSYFVQNSNSDSFYILPVFINGNGYCAQQGSSTTELFINYNVRNNASSTQLYSNNVLQNVTNRGQVYTALNGRKLVLHSNMDIINTDNQTNTLILYGAYNYTGLADFGGYLSEYIIFPNTLQSSNRTGISNNINTYYSIYPNPTSVWNLLNAVYSADTIASSSLKTSLVASYNGESNTNDSFGTNNGTAVGGLTYGTGKIGNAFVGNGTTSYIEVGDKFDLGLSSWSYNIWFYPTNLSFNRTLFSKTAWAAGGGRIEFTISGALMVFSLTLSDGNTITIRDNSTVLPGSQWINLTVVVDRNDKIKLYYNGVLSTNVVNLGSVNNNLIPYINDNLNNTRPFRIGCGSGTDGFNPETPTRFAQGSIDSFNIWNKVLTQAEITELYNSGNGAQYIGDNFYKPTTNDALNTYNGTAQGGLTYGVGKVGTAFQFNGTNAFVSMANNSFNLTGDFSISLWMYITSTGSNQDLFSNADIVSSVDRGYRLSFRGPTNFIRFSIYGGSIVNLDTTTSAIPLNTWTHVVATRKASTGSKIYINGVLSTSDTSVVNPNYAGTFAPCIGVYKSTTTPSTINYLTNGSRIDALNIWNKELSTSEITELYNSGNGKQYPN